MSDSYNSGHYASESAKREAEKSSAGELHDWVKHGMWPSTWYKCAKCDATRYSK